MLFNERGVAQLRTPDNLTLHCRAWLPVVPPKGIILLVHGYAEHIGRYDHVAERLTREGYAVYGYDMRGHGRSDGRRAYIHSFDLLVADLALVHEAIGHSFGDIPNFILAHSLGTTVTLQYLIRHAPKLAGVVLSGTAVKPGSDIPRPLIALSGLVGDLFPRLPTIRLDAESLSRDFAVVESYRTDPFVYTDAIPARTGASINRAFADLQKNLNTVTAPVLFLHGAEDRLIDPSGSELAFELIGSEDKTIELLPNLYHEILNEPEKDEVLDRVVAWVGARR